MVTTTTAPTSAPRGVAASRRGGERTHQPRGGARHGDGLLEKEERARDGSRAEGEHAQAHRRGEPEQVSLLPRSSSSAVARLFFVVVVVVVAVDIAVAVARLPMMIIITVGTQVSI